MSNSSLNQHREEKIKNCVEPQWNQYHLSIYTSILYPLLFRFHSLNGSAASLPSTTTFLFRPSNRQTPTTMGRKQPPHQVAGWLARSLSLAMLFTDRLEEQETSHSHIPIHATNYDCMREIIIIIIIISSRGSSTITLIIIIVGSSGALPSHGTDGARQKDPLIICVRDVWWAGPPEKNYCKKNNQNNNVTIGLLHCQYCILNDYWMVMGENNIRSVIHKDITNQDMYYWTQTIPTFAFNISILHDDLCCSIFMVVW